MTMEGQTSGFRDLAAESAKENSQMDESLKKIINEVQELSDTNPDNDNMSDLFEDNFFTSLNITEDQVKTLTKELGKLEKKYKDNESILKEIRDLTLLLESKIDGEQRKASFNKINEMIPNRLGDLSDLSNTDKRNIESFINIPENQNAVMELYFRMLPVQLDNVQQETKIRNYDKKVFNKVKWRIEGKYDKDARWSWELDNKIFTDNFFTTWIEANPDWDGSDAQDDTKIKEMHKDTPHEFSTEQFTKKFEAVNKVRKENNDAKLSWFDIVAKLWTETMGKITRKQWEGDQKTVYYDKGDGNDPTVLTADNFMQELNINAESVWTIEWTLFGKGELEQGITNQKDNRFGKIVGSATEITEPEPPQVESLEASDIQINLFNNISADDVKSAVDAAIANLSAEWLDQATKEKFAERIKEVTAALKDGWQELGRGRKPWHENIKQLQETMQQELTLNPRLRPDWKLWRLTFYAMQKYMWVETEKSWDLKYECGHMLGNNLSGMLENFEDQDYLSRALWDNNSDLQWLQDKAENYIRNPLKYVKDRLDGKLWTCDVPWKTILSGILNESPTIKNKIKLLQFALLPDYTWNIDGIIWPATKKALQSYVDKNRWDNPGDKIKPLWDNIVGDVLTTIGGLDAGTRNAINDETTAYDNTYALIGNKTMKFFDSTTIRNLEIKTVENTSSQSITWIINGKKYSYRNATLFNGDWSAASYADKRKYEAHFWTAYTTLSN